MTEKCLMLIIFKQAMTENENPDKDSRKKGKWLKFILEKK